MPVRCRRNSCPYCRRLNVQVTAAMMGLNASMSDDPPRYAVLTTTRDWLSDQQLRDAWEEFPRRVRRYVQPRAGFAWFREWTTGRADGVRRTHYHSVWTGIENDDQAAAVAEISRSIMAARAGAWSPEAHGYQRVWDAGGLARYVAGLVGHHLKEGQQPPPGWKGRRYGTSRGFYVMDARELRKLAELAARDDRLRYRLTLELLDESAMAIPVDIVDEVVTGRLEAVKERAATMPAARIVSVPEGYWRG